MASADPAPSRAVLDWVLCHLPQQADAGRRAVARYRCDVAHVPTASPRSGKLWLARCGRERHAAAGYAAVPMSRSVATLTSWLTASSIAPAPLLRTPGRPLLRRLDRAEYGNVIQDLLGVEVDARSLLPADDSAFGFDNNADLLVVSPSLLDRYLSAADRVSAPAVGDPSTATGSDTLHARRSVAEPACGRAAARHCRRHRRAPLVSSRRRI